jgi:hypothetical protein
MPGNLRSMLSLRGSPRFSTPTSEAPVGSGRWIRRSAISAVMFAIVTLSVLPTGAVAWAVEVAGSTARFRYGGLQQGSDFSIYASPNPASPGDSVKVSFSSLDRNVVITACSARLDGNAGQGCTQSGGVWSATLQVPGNAAPGSTAIEVAIAYLISDGVDTGEQGDINDTIPFEIVLPPSDTGDPSATTAGPPPTTAGPLPTTVVPPNVQETPPSPSATSSLWGILVFLVLLIVIAVVVGRRGRRRPRAREQVQARVRPGPPATPRIEQIGERPAWVLRIDPHRDRATERIEEIHR